MCKPQTSQNEPSRSRTDATQPPDLDSGGCATSGRGTSGVGALRGRLLRLVPALEGTVTGLLVRLAGLARVGRPAVVAFFADGRLAPFVLHLVVAGHSLGLLESLVTSHLFRLRLSGRLSPPPARPAPGSSGAWGCAPRRPCSALSGGALTQ